MYNLDDVDIHTHTHTHFMAHFFFMNLIFFAFYVDECMNFKVYEFYVYECMNLFNLINYFLKC
jgi:hypothetical protein